MKKIICILLAGSLLFMFAACSKDDDQGDIVESTVTTQPTTEAVVIRNPYTGEDGYNEDAVGKRPVAIVVENQYNARPQWGIGTSDIIVEGEVEGGITRMLWVYADYTSVPDKVGPTRSARPSYVKASEWFDAVFIHWGGSGSDGPYVGGYATIKNDGVDDLDGIAGGEVFGRDTTRNVDLEHRGVVYGDKIASALKSKNIRTTTDTDKFTTFDFYEKATALSKSSATTITNKFANGADTRTFTYSKEDKLYHTSDWQQDVSFKNVLILSAVTDRYTVGQKGTTYVNYALTNGSGYLFSQGTKKTIKWSVSDNKLTITDTDGKAVKLNVGKLYIGFSSSDDGGAVTVTGENTGA